MVKKSTSSTSTSTSAKSPMDTAGIIIRTSSGRTFGRVTTFSGQRETQKVIDSLLMRAKSPQSKLGN